MSRLRDVKRFYHLIDRLEQNTCAKRKLKDCNAAEVGADGGVYLFFEKGEKRNRSGKGFRIVYVGVCTSLRRRIRSHRGHPTKPLGGSNLRRHITRALFLKHRCDQFADWPDIGDSTWRNMHNKLDDGPQKKQRKKRLERMIRQHIWPMRLLFVPIGREKHRLYIERNAIGLLSECGATPPIDPPSGRWLGRHSRQEGITSSGLWNIRHVRNGYEPKFMDTLEKYVSHCL